MFIICYCVLFLFILCRWLQLLFWCNVAALYAHKRNSGETLPRKVEHSNSNHIRMACKGCVDITRLACIICNTFGEMSTVNHIRSTLYTFVRIWLEMQFSTWSNDVSPKIGFWVVMLKNLIYQFTRQLGLPEIIILENSPAMRPKTQTGLFICMVNKCSDEIFINFLFIKTNVWVISTFLH